MEQNTMEQLMEFMKTQIGSLERKIHSNQAESKAERKADCIIAAFPTPACPNLYLSMIFSYYNL
jgi:hypothetical protein